jgi:hypothetical protein
MTSAAPLGKTGPALLDGFARGNGPARKPPRRRKPSR